MGGRFRKVRGVNAVHSAVVTGRRQILTRLLYACLAAAAWSAAAFDLMSVAGVSMRSFLTRGAPDKQGRRWELAGSKAVIRGNIVELTDARLKLTRSDGGVIRITSPACAFDRAGGVGRSDSPLHVAGPGFVLDGLGYDIFVREQILRVRQRVRMTVKRHSDIYRRAPFLKSGHGSGKPKPAGEIDKRQRNRTGTIPGREEANGHD